MNGTTGMPGRSPYFAKRSARHSGSLPGRATRGSLPTRPGAAKSHISRSHSSVSRLSKFMPAPSPVSMGPSSPARYEVRNELNRCTRAVLAQPSGSSFANFITCAAAKRSMAGEPVRVRSESPKRASRAATSSPVEESIQIGLSARENEPSAARYTVACCCASPPMDSILSIGAPDAFRRSSTRSRPFIHIAGFARRTRASAFGRKPSGDPNSGRSFP